MAPAENTTETAPSPLGPPAPPPQEGAASLVEPEGPAATPDRRHGKALQFLVALLVCFFLSDRLAGWGFSRLVEHSQFRLSRIYRGGLKADILILGNSRGVNGFLAPLIEEKTGRPTYNLSFNGMDFQTAEALFADYLDHNQTPKLLVVEITALHSRELAKGLKFLVPESERLSALLNDRYYSIWVAGELSHVYRFNSEVFLRELFYLRKSDQNWLNDRSVDTEVSTSYVMPETEHAKWAAVNPAYLAPLIRLVRLAQARHIEVRAVVTPYLPIYNQQATEYPQWKKTVQTALGESCPIWEYRTALEQPEHFADVIHANRQGSIAFLDVLLRDHFFDAGAQQPHAAAAGGVGPGAAP